MPSKPVLAFNHLASAGKKIATEKMVAQARKFYPEAYYHLGSDGVDDLSDIAEAHGLDYTFYEERMGYPTYSADKIVKWLERFKYACEKAQEAKATHMMMMEDDVWIKGPLTVREDWEMACHFVSHGNDIHPDAIKLMTEYSGHRWAYTRYGGGGGSIYKIDTFLNNFDYVCEFIRKYADEINTYYPPFGFMDCYMNVFYMLCGKHYTVNPYMTDTHHHTNDGYDYDYFVKMTRDHIQIVNNYKKYYWPLTE